MELTDIAKDLLEEVRKLTETENVVGKPLHVGDTVIIPVSKLSVGFGTGQGPAKGGEAQPGGLGAGIAMQPLGFLVVNGSGEAQLLALSSAKQGAIVKAIEAVPQLVEQLKQKGNGKGGAALTRGEKPESSGD